MPASPLRPMRPARALVAFLLDRVRLAAEAGCLDVVISRELVLSIARELETREEALLLAHQDMAGLAAELESAREVIARLEGTTPAEAATDG